MSLKKILTLKLLWHANSIGKILGNNGQHNLISEKNLLNLLLSWSNVNFSTEVMLKPLEQERTYQDGWRWHERFYICILFTIHRLIRRTLWKI